MLSSLCVFCGSASGDSPGFVEAAQTFGRELARREIRLVYGGASVGLMGALADSVLAAGGTAIGVIPHALVKRELAHRALTELHEVTTMHERKAVMAELADAFVALPGGLGTLEELFEIWTWGMLGIHDKPYGLLDVNGFFEPLIAFIDHARDHGFIRDEQRARLIVETDASRLLDALSRRLA